MTRCSIKKCNENGHHCFPKDLKYRRLWEKATKIPNFKATKNSRLCRKHFKESDYEETTDIAGLPPRRNLLKDSVVPSIFPWTKALSLSGTERKKRYEVRHTKKESLLSSAATPSTEQKSYSQVACGLESVVHVIEETDIEDINSWVPDVQMEVEIHNNKENQVNLLTDIQELNSCVPHAQMEVEIEIQNHKENQVSLLSNSPRFSNSFTQTPYFGLLFSNEQLLQDDEMVKYYTGLETYDRFRTVLSTLLPMAYDIVYRGSQVLNMSVEDQFLLMLMKLRRNMSDYILSKHFNISKTEVGNVFVTWVNFVHQMWSLLNIWPTRGLVHYYMPAQFKNKHKSTRVIVDGTEVPITRPKNPKSQQATFSTYKHHNTIKFLVGATPGGILSYCSEGFAGSTSDRQIVERSDLIKKCQPGDSIMADRGFNVQDILAPKDITLLIPSFLKGFAQLPGVKLRHDQELAANRIHIERLIGLLCNFREKIVK